MLHHSTVHDAVTPAVLVISESRKAAANFMMECLKVVKTSMCIHGKDRSVNIDSKTILVLCRTGPS